jgi:dTDP-4-amino-4,6-dideoxygalactose transaminase
MNIPYNDLSRIHEPLKNSFHTALDQVLQTSAFVGDKQFAEDFRIYTGSNHCVTCNSGTDALYIAIKSLELTPGSRIAVPAVSYAATAMAVVNAGHIPVFIDVDSETGLMLTDKVKDVDCVIPVHLYGQCVDMKGLLELGVPVIEDCAQAHGARIEGKHVGNMGVIGCFSFYPGKNMGALGDGGACITNDEKLSIKMKQYASLGSPLYNRYEHTTDGVNSRMDGLQGLFLTEKLKHIDAWTDQRISIARRYQTGSQFPNRSCVGKDVYHVFHTLQEDRDAYIKFMNERGIQTGIHYPHPLPELKCFSKYHILCKNAIEFCKKCVSLPLFPGMSDEEVDFTLKSHTSFLQSRTKL